jgi:putative membrane protein
MLWIKAWHIIAMVAWFAGLFYLPRLFVYHADTWDEISLARFKVMEYRLYYAITWPAGLLTTLFGVWLSLAYMPYALKMPYMHAKLGLVALVWGYHLLCGHYLRVFQTSQNKRSSYFYRVFNEIPTLLLIGIVLLVVVKPSMQFF